MAQIPVKQSPFCFVLPVDFKGLVDGKVITLPEFPVGSVITNITIEGSDASKVELKERGEDTEIAIGTSFIVKVLNVGIIDISLKSGQTIETSAPKTKIIITGFYPTESLYSF